MRAIVKSFYPNLKYRSSMYITEVPKKSAKTQV